MDLPYDPMIPLLGTYPKEPSTLTQKNISILMFIVVLFTRARIWKQPRSPSIDQWIKLLWDTYIMEYYSVTQKEENCTLCDSMDGTGEYYAK